MPTTIKTEIIIQATPERVWLLLSQFDNYPEWNPFIKSVQGEVKVGNTITVRIQSSASKEMTFKPKILVLETNKELSWLGHFLFRGLFDGAHTFVLTDNGNGTTLFRQQETFRGILVPLFKKQLDTYTRKGFMAMNQKLKELSELP
jgi:hypothetical protein